MGTVPSAEIGKVFSILEVAKGITQLIAPPIYGHLYKSTLRTVPEAFLYLKIACKCLIFIAGVVILIELNKKIERERLSQKERLLKTQITNNDEQPVRTPNIAS